ncbi:MAG: glycosyltransferase family 2 protein [Bacteroidetes bacterium]|nr:glycosyltransferase family 2 protein [Bacteroidota bacterium]
MLRTIEISVVVPVLNEKENMSELTRRLTKVLDSDLQLSYEIIFVDDGSTDGSWQEIADLHMKNNRIKGVSFSRNFGHQSALSAGINEASGNAVFTLDGDLQHPPELLSQFYSLYKQGYDIVAGVRQEDKRLPFLKRVFSILYYWLFNRLSEVKITVGTSDFRLLSRRVIDFLRSLPEHDKFFRALIPWSGFKTCYVPYRSDQRFRGSPKFSFLKSFLMGLDGVTSFSVRPLYLSMYAGFIIALTALLYGLYAVYVKLILHAVPPGFTDIVASILFLGGIQLIVLGIIGIYIGKIKMQISGRPGYIVAGKYGLEDDTQGYSEEAGGSFER